MTTYYVDNSSTNASDGNPGTSAGAPLKSLAALNNMHFQPGDTIAFKAGTVYSASAAGKGALEVSSSGTASAPITFTSYGTGAKPIINNTSSATNSEGIEVDNASFDRIDGLAVHQAVNAGVEIGSGASHVTVTNSEMTNTGFGVYAYGQSNVVSHNYIHDLHMVNDTPQSVNNNDDYGAVGVVVNGNNDEVAFNKVVNASASSYDYGRDGGGVETWGNVTNLSVHDNWVENARGFFEAGGGDLSNATFQNNVCLNNGGFMVLQDGGEFGGNYSNVVAKSNTIVEQHQTSSQDSTVVLTNQGLSSSDFDFVDNIVSLNNGTDVFANYGSQDHSDNLLSLS
jgi:hypothetical protein